MGIGYLLSQVSDDANDASAYELNTFDDTILEGDSLIENFYAKTAPEALAKGGASYSDLSAPYVIRPGLKDPPPNIFPASYSNLSIAPHELDAATNVVSADTLKRILTGAYRGVRITGKITNESAFSTIYAPPVYYDGCCQVNAESESTGSSGDSISSRDYTKVTGGRHCGGLCGGGGGLVHSAGAINETSSASFTSSDVLSSVIRDDAAQYCEEQGGDSNCCHLATCTSYNHTPEPVTRNEITNLILSPPSFVRRRDGAILMFIEGYMSGPNGVYLRVFAPTGVAGTDGADPVGYGDLVAVTGAAGSICGVSLRKQGLRYHHVETEVGEGNITPDIEIAEL